MLTQGEVLKFISERTERGRSTSCDEVAEEYDLEETAACGHLKRLWRERLIETASSRPLRFKFRLTPGERLWDLRFKIAPRGKAKLNWIAEQEDWF